MAFHPSQIWSVHRNQRGPLQLAKKLGGRGGVAEAGRREAS